MILQFFCVCALWVLKGNSSLLQLGFYCQIFGQHFHQFDYSIFQTMVIAENLKQTSFITTDLEGSRNISSQTNVQVVNIKRLLLKKVWYGRSTLNSVER